MYIKGIQEALFYIWQIIRSLGHNVHVAYIEQKVHVTGGDNSIVSN